MTYGNSAGNPLTKPPFGSSTQPPYTISGTVKDQQNQPVSGVTVALTGTQSGQTTTNSSGQHSFSGLAAGDYTLTPSKSGFVFTPSSLLYPSLSRNRTDANFTALPALQKLFNKTINYAYNSVGALSGVGTDLIGSDPNATTNVLNTLTFRASGAIKTVNYGNDRKLVMGYDENRQQPTSMKVERISNSSDKVIDYAYEYYTQSGLNDGRIRKITDNTNSSYTTNYYYDDYNRLMNAANGVYSGFYQYDPWGNIKTLDETTFNYDTSGGAPTTNRILSTVSGGVTYNHAYDAAGNMTNDGVQGYTYDGANRLKEVGTGGTNTYGYDGDGARVRQTSGGTPLFYVRSSMLKNVAMEVSQAQTVVRAYVYVGNKVVALQSKDGQFYWAHQNHLGSGRAMTDVSGNLIYYARMAPYGKLLQEYSSSGDPNLNTRKFTGYERDTSGLDYANARMYSSERGRFLQSDQLGLDAANLKDPESLNLYNYVHNDPVNLIDPNGEYAIYASASSDWLYALGFTLFCRDYGYNSDRTRDGGYGGGGSSGGGRDGGSYKEQPQIKLLRARNLSDPISDSAFIGRTSRIPLPEVNCTNGSKFTLSISGILLNVSDLYPFRPGTDKTPIIRSEMSFDPEDPFKIDYQSINVQVSDPRDVGRGDVYRDFTITVSIERVGNQNDIGGRLFIRLVGRGPNDSIGKPDQVIQEGSIKFTCEN